MRDRDSDQKEETQEKEAQREKDNRKEDKSEPSPSREAKTEHRSAPPSPPPAAHVQPEEKAGKSLDGSHEAAHDHETAKPPEPLGPPPPPETWSVAEVEAGRLDCEHRIAHRHVIFDFLPPLRQGACGNPAPIRLRGFENADGPDVTFTTTPTISCKMAEALRRWLDTVVQPAAKAHLHATIVRVSDLSGYVCRTRYESPTQRISQHAYANALDVSTFVTARGEEIGVLDHWSSNDERSAFLHEIHDGACEIFGTTLGPEANDAHKNHFHLDMTERRHPLCDFTPAQARAREEAKRQPVASANATAKAAAQEDKDTPRKPREHEAPPKPAVAETPPDDKAPAKEKHAGTEAGAKEEAPEAPPRRKHRRRGRYLLGLF